MGQDLGSFMWGAFTFRLLLESWTTLTFLGIMCEKDMEYSQSGSYFLSILSLHHTDRISDYYD